MWSEWLVILCLCVLAKSQDNLLKNGGFENPNSILPWKCVGCKATGIMQCQDGYWCVMVTERHQSWSAMTQTVKSNGTQNYIFKSYIKLLNVAQGKMYTTIHVYVQYINTNGKTIKERFAELPKMEVGFGWIELGGDFYVPNLSTKEFSISIEIPDYKVEYVLDNATLIEMPNNPSWKSEARARIDRIRKAQLTFRPVSHHINPYYCSHYGGAYCIDISRMYVEIKQIRSEYAFGATSTTDNLVGNMSNPKYSQFMYENFEWILLEKELEWNNMELQQGHLENDTTTDTLEQINVNRLKTWGSGLFSALRRHNPEWLTRLSSWDIKKAIQARFNYMSSLYNNSFNNLDVYSDTLLSDFLETMTHKVNITEELFKTAKAMFPLANLFLDEDNVLNGSLHTTAYTNMAKRLQGSKTPVYGLGIKAHFNTTDIDMDVLKYRLDKLAEANLPIWISKLAIHDRNVTKRASKLEDIMTLLYSYQEVEGIILDDIWNTEHLDASLVDGGSVQLNEAGNVYVNRWHTHEIRRFTSTVNLRGYKGEYDIIVRRGCNSCTAIHTERITLGDDGKSLTIHVIGQGQNYRFQRIAIG